MGLSKQINPGALMWAGYAGMFFFIPLSHSLVEICGALVLAVWIFSGKFLSDIKIWLHTAPALPVIALIVLPWIGLVYTPVPSDGLNVASKGYYWLFSMGLITVLKRQNYPDMIIKMFLAGLFVNSIVSMLQIGGIVPLKYGSSSGLLVISSPWITYSLLLTAGIFISSFYFFRAQTKRERFLYGFLVLPYLVTIGSVGGRSGYIALIVLSPLLLYAVIGRQHILKILLPSVAFVAVLSVFPVVQSRVALVKEDLLLYRQGNINTSIGLRFHMWGIAVSEIEKHPFSGIGTGGFKESWRVNKKDPALPFFDHPHSSFLHVTVSYGIAGLIAFCWLLFVMLKTGWSRRDTPLGFALFAFTLVFAVGSLTDTQILTFPTAMGFSLFAGIAGAMDA